MIKNIIIQAGGIGSRMGNLTTVKPKCLVPIFGKPIIFHLFDHYPDANYCIICDYKSEVLIKYIEKFRPKIKINYTFTKEKGTVSGIKDCLRYIPENEDILLTWSDLVFNCIQEIPKIETDILIGVTNESCAFDCRWQVNNRELIEKPSTISGICGLFFIKNKNVLSNIPKSGQFTDFLKNTNFDTFNIKNIIDIGTYTCFDKYQKNNRYFNDIKINSETVEKKAIVKEYEKLIKDEIDWYELVSSLGFFQIPSVISKNPYVMTKIEGINPFLKEPNKNFFLNVIDGIKKLHGYTKIPEDKNEMRDVYVNKTFQRVESVKELIPYFSEKTITINGKDLVNPFHEDEYCKFISEIQNTLINTKTSFGIIHGDCTFSNIIAQNNFPYFIDPRGYFGKQKYYGDTRYDWAKLYYSFVGNYDNINLKRYFITVNDDHVFFHIEKNGWEIFENEFFNNIPVSKKEIKLLHVLIWFSLCGYVIEDYSSILISFYKGVELWNEYEKEFYEKT
jgi:GTP:adenosylcobinamide-phosphate guanylyltransferase